MESFGAFLDEEWESLSKLFSNEDSDNIFTNFNSGNSFSNNSEVPSNFLANGDQNNVYGVNNDQSLFFPSDNTFDHTNFYCNTISQESSNSNSALFTNQSNGVHNILHDHVTNNTFESIDYYNMDSKNNVPNLSDDLMEDILQLKSELRNDQFSNIAETNNDSCKEMQLKRKSTDEDIINSPDQNPKKKPRVSKDAQKNKRTYTRSKKNKKDVQINNNDEENNTEGNSITCSSEDDSNIASSQELNGSESKDSISLNSKGKAKASRGSATDPQSLYARRRRERINERLKILQNLVPNGTKVDISTMLEEAVHYVKFLQLQIKLLSSDEMWMYAPIAYNGMDMGLYQKLFS